MYVNAGVALLGGGAVLLWLIGRWGPRRGWQVVPGGFRAEPRPALRAILGVLLLLGMALTAASVVLDGGEDGTQPLVFGCFFVLIELIRSPTGPVVVSPAGLSIGGRLYPWSDVHQAYLMGTSVEVRVPPRWITWFGDRRVHLRGRAYLVPANEMHWLIQHYLLFPAQRERMDSLPTRAFELPV